MRYGELTVELVREPVEVGILVDAGRQSEPFVANHNRRGATISDNAQQIRLSADEALAVLGWLREHEEELKAMVEEEVEAVGLVASSQALAR